MKTDERSLKKLGEIWRAANTGYYLVDKLYNSVQKIVYETMPKNKINNAKQNNNIILEKAIICLEEALKGLKELQINNL